MNKEIMKRNQRLIDFINRRFIQLRGGNKTISTELDTSFKPTQKDKPSPTSHFGLSVLKRRVQKTYPDSQGYRTFLIANTNSMEPIIDDHTVVCGEDLRTTLGKKYLRMKPLKIGDVCSYEGDPRFWGRTSDAKLKRIIHTIVERKKFNGRYRYRFKGYNNFIKDPSWIQRKQIVSRNFSFNNAQQPRRGD